MFGEFIAGESIIGGGLVAAFLLVVDRLFAVWRQRRELYTSEKKQQAGLDSQTEDIRLEREMRETDYVVKLYKEQVTANSVKIERIEAKMDLLDSEHASCRENLVREQERNATYIDKIKELSVRVKELEARVKELEHPK